VIKGKVKATKTTKLMTRTFLADVPEDKAFWAHDGRLFKNLDILAQGLGEMSDETFRYHVNESKNDFATWVRDVIGDDELAAMLQQDMTRQDAQSDVISRIEYLMGI
jgi:hypothetical protein